jgi:hypothetical protein
LRGRANRAVPNNLAKRAEHSQIRTGVQVRPTLVPNLADLGYLGMMVKDFRSKEVNFTD